MTPFDSHAPHLMDMPPLEAMDLGRRLTLATAADTVRGLLFHSVLKTVRSLTGEKALDPCWTTLNGRRFVDYFDYSISDFLRLVFTAAQCITRRHGDFERALHALGRQGASDFLESATGKTLLTISGRDPRQIISRLPMSLRTLVNFGDRSVEWVGRQHCRLTMKRDFLPSAYLQGQLHAFVETLNPGPVTVRSFTTGPVDSEHLVYWS